MSHGSVRVLLVAGALLALLLPACKMGVKKAIDDRRADVKANLDNAQKIGLSLAAIPPVTKDGMQIPAPVVIASGLEEAVPSATLMYAEDIAELSAPRSHADRLVDAQLLPECASLLSAGKHLASSNPNVHENVVKAYLDKCKSVKYLFVLRTHKKEARAFEGDLLAFELASGKPLGGFAIDIKSAGRTDRVTNTTTTTKTTTGVTGRRRTTVTKTTTAGAVNADASQLAQEVSDAVEGGILKHVPGSRFAE